jgi:hypothetical protein
LKILDIRSKNGYSRKRKLRMSAIPDDWSLAALLLFGGALTALAAGAAVLIAESWFQKMRRRREHFKIWQDGHLKMWRDRQRESFLWLSSGPEKVQSRSESRVHSDRIGNQFKTWTVIKNLTPIGFRFVGFPMIRWRP